ncbi:alpha,alpha-trehalase TreF [Sphingobium sp.]|uniref:alpha,alpha-trehalase TreF n=1 Tax=Sphingobium sp. TaxID=1912891 RepID=UPI003B3A561E
MTKWQSFVAAGLVSLIALGSQATAQSSPADIYGPLFERIQLEKLFPDGKTFVDAVPRSDPDAIMVAYRQEQPQGKDALKAFVLRHFLVPGVNDHGASNLRSHVRNLWPTLVRQPVERKAGSSALPLPAPFVVPGGRFREIYYWDSYFTMLGLAVDGQQPLIESMLVDFTSTIEIYGHIPNGMRSYYLSRSQPPFYAMMLDLSKDESAEAATRQLSALRAEYAYWMKGASCVQPTGACERVVKMPDGTLLNRYWDDKNTPRDESYAEDVATAADAKGDKAVTYRHLRAGAESGWDFTSRWFGDGRTIATIHTTDIVPVDLNSLMLAMEQRIEVRCQKAGDSACASEFAGLARKRKAAIDRYLWVGKEGRYADWDSRAKKPTAVLSAATLYPLFVGASSPAQASAVATTVRAKLLGSGGLRTTPNATGQQWDTPNGWAPLQWVAIDGLARNGQEALARDIAGRWIGTVAAAYAQTGKMLEKYDVEERKPGGGGEYPLQDGFGWTNGVTSALLERYPDIAADLEKGE